MENVQKVYVYCDPRFTNKGKGYEYNFGNKGKIKLKHKPFYIGCASWRRHRRHLYKNAQNKDLSERIKKIRESGFAPIVLILKKFCLKDRKKAFRMEEKLIEAVGRKDLGTGPLLNKCDGRCGKNDPKALRRILNYNLSHCTSGENNPCAIFTNREEDLILKEYEEGGTSHRKLAAKYRARSKTTIARVIGRAIKRRELQ